MILIIERFFILFTEHTGILSLTDPENILPHLLNPQDQFIDFILYSGNPLTSFTMRLKSGFNAILRNPGLGRCYVY